MPDESLLDRVELVATRQPLNRRDGAPSDLDYKRHAGANRHAIEPDSASRTCAPIAGDFRSGQSKWPPEGLGKRHARLDSQWAIHVIYVEDDIVRRVARRRAFVDFRSGSMRNDTNRPCAKRHIDRSAENIATRQSVDSHESFSYHWITMSPWNRSALELGQTGGHFPNCGSTRGERLRYGVKVTVFNVWAIVLGGYLYSK